MVANKVNINEVKESLNNLDEIAKKYPHLVNKESTVSVDDWVDVLKEQEHAKD
jgi:hypothetical protein